MSNEQRPLFSVGERVKLVSRDYPECNNICHIRAIVWQGEIYEDKFSGFLRANYIDGGGFGYTLEELEISELDDAGREVECTWCESALRKIYDNGEYSFDELMNVLKSPVTVNDNA